MKPNTIKIDDHQYVRADSIKEPAEKLYGLDYVIIRTHSAGVFAGYLKSREGKEVELLNARRLWYWSGSSSLSELANRGVSKPKECKFPCEVDSIILTEAIEIIPTTKEAQESINNVKEWTSH